MHATPTMVRQRFTDLNSLSLAFPLGSFHVTMLGWGFIEPYPWRNYLHTHSFFEVCYAFQGRGTFRMRGDDYAVQAGDLFVAKPSEPHEIISTDDDPLGIYFWSYTLVPPRGQVAHAQGIDGLLRAFFSAERCVSTRAPLMSHTLELLTEEIVLRQPGYAESVVALAVKLLLDTARAVVDAPIPVEQFAAPVRHHAEAVAQRIARFLRDNASRPLSVRDVAAEVHLSERHTSRLFHQTMGISIMAYLTALRLEMAAQLLLDQQLSIKEVAQASGYPSVHHFATLFRRRMGLTPAMFRRQGGTSFL